MGKSTKKKNKKNKFRKEDLNYPAEILCRYFFSQKAFGRQKIKHNKKVLNRKVPVMTKGGRLRSASERCAGMQNNINNYINMTKCGKCQR